MSPVGGLPGQASASKRLTLVASTEPASVERGEMHAFLMKNRDELLARSEVTVRQRVGRRQGVGGGEGLHRLLDRLTSTLDAAHADEPIDITKTPSPASKAWVPLHGSQGDQQELDFALSDVVHSYSDVVQTVRDVALEKGVSLGLEEFRALDECLDNAISEAVTDFNAVHDDTLNQRHREDTRERVGFLVHELRNAVGTASLAASALDIGGMTMNSPMGAVLKRSLAALSTLIHRAVEQVRSDTSPQTPAFSLAEFIADAQTSSQLDASAKGCRLAVPPVDPLLMIRANRELLQAALANLLQNAFKFTHPHSEVTLRAYALGNHIIIEVEDHCGGLAAGKAEKMFMPFHQRSDDKSGLGLGLSIARKSIEQDLGTLSVRDLPGTGCVFEIRLPRFWPQ